MTQENKPKVYIDGQAGTTGLTLLKRLQDREDIDLLLIEEENRHDNKRRQELMEEADLVFLCLPDDASIQASYWIEPEKKVIDTSTAHRTLWEYGFPDLSEHFKENIRHSKRVSNPGCHASGIIALLYPLVAGGLLKRDESLSCFSLTGYSGGGKKMIEQYESDAENYEAPFAYSLNVDHKHLKEISKIVGLKKNIQFIPVVDDFYSGMAVFIPLSLADLKVKMGRDALIRFYADWYKNSKTITVMQENPDRIKSNALAGYDDLEIYVFGNEHQVVLCALLDNLGKGACGAAIANMNLMLGLDEQAGLNLKHQK